MTTQPDKAALYVRVSTAEQAEGHSIEGQLECLRSYAAEHGYRVFNEYVDPGFQGDTEDRPALRRLLADAREGRFTCLLVYRYDRLFREVRLFLNTEHDLRQSGVRIISVTEAIDDTHEGRLQLLIKGSFAEYEKAVIRQRAELGRNRAALEGKWMGGPPPYGYDLDPSTSRLVVNQKEAEWVRQFFEWLVRDQLTLTGLQRRVNDLSIPTKFETKPGKKTVNRRGWWMQRTLGRILTRDLYTGTFHYRKIAKPRSVKRKDATLREEDEWIPVSVPPLIDKKLFEMAQEQLRKNSELSPRRTNHPYLLRRLVECGRCGRVWIATTNNYDCPYYICSGRRKAQTSARCERRSISASKLEPLVWESVTNLLSSPNLVLKALERRFDAEGLLRDREAALQSLLRRLEKARREEKRLLRAYKEGLISFMAFKEEVAETRERMVRLEEDRRRLESELKGWISQDERRTAVSNLANRVLNTLPQLSYEGRCEVVRQMVERVVVREDEVEIHTIFPESDGKRENAAVALQDNAGVDGPTKHTGILCLMRPIDPSRVVRITLYADLPKDSKSQLRAA